MTSLLVPWKSPKRMSARRLARLMSFWPPMLGAGIRVRYIADDWTECRAELVLNKLNRNTHGTAFGGSIQAMSDAFFALLLVHQLGDDYNVWDQAAEVKFVSPGSGSVFGTFEVPKQIAEEVRAEAASGEKVLRWFETKFTLADGTVVAEVRRQLYIRKKKGR
ncbi:DUF4442 domain-containing protein [Rudaeicoccus suwonensis]|uniref:Acyl-coenzyme A thioesterase PaaI-like protein n=1 Tax=Rudaeicoccus suwonensis TaxID=657409 RepID=A0A561E9M3_9MICO|nr:DUF4442 domain-containing protein [Rudaeicoccus suwonensis]TWE12315.1 acyl-coenzyme A thioesterase PaaI-like protein [Rudaeicoccus suwonensis]